MACCDLGGGEGSGDGDGAGSELGFLKVVLLGMLVVMVLVDQRCRSPNPGLGLAGVLLLDAVVLGPVFVRCLGVLGFRILLCLVDCVDSVQVSRLRYLIRILSSLGLSLGLDGALLLVVGLPFLLERQVFASIRIRMALHELRQSGLVCLLEAN